MNALALNVNETYVQQFAESNGEDQIVSSDPNSEVGEDFGSVSLETPGGNLNEDTAFAFNDTLGQQSEEKKKKRTGLAVKYVKEIKKMKVGKTNKDCSVCMCNFVHGEIIRLLPCGHIFHDTCVKPWLMSQITCPYCRYDLKVHFSKQKATEIQKDIKTTTKPPGPIV